jgi:hypothetical protein
MKRLLLLFIPFFFACSVESNQLLADRIAEKYFIYTGFSGEIAVNKPMLNGETLHHKWQFFADQDCYSYTGNINYVFYSSSEDIVNLSAGPYYVSYRLIKDSPLTLAYSYGGGIATMEEISLTELDNLISGKPDGCCNVNITCPTN